VVRHRKRTLYPLVIALAVACLLGVTGLAMAHLGSAARPTAAATTLNLSDRASQRVSRDLARNGPPSLSASPSASASPSMAPSSAAPTAAPPLPSPTRPAPKPSTKPAVPAGCGQYSGNQLIACQLLPSFGFATSEMSALVPMWNRESGWRTTAQNPSSGAYGIPQALPGDKMASVASDWRTNAATQIKWGLGYIRDRYGSPSAAWAFWQNNGWY
jgi:cytoskeletal protein RodZ